MPISLPTISPTPIHKIRLPRPVEQDNRFFIKRDDLLPVCLGGNKVRIALEFLADMDARGCDALVMYGDLQSNLCRVLSGLCHELGLPCLMVATSHEEAGLPSYNETLVRRLGVRVLVCEKGDVASSVDEAMNLLRAQGRRPYYIYGNRYGTGNEGVGARAYERAYREICHQEHELGERFDLIVTPYGTGCTQGGLVCGSLRADDGRHIVGISISSRPPTRAREVLEQTVEDWFSRSGHELPANWRDAIDLQCGYNRGGYGLVDEAVNGMVEYMLSENGIPTDPTYTGKALLGLVDYLRDHELQGANVLFIHTGGLPLFFDYLARG